MLHLGIVALVVALAAPAWAEVYRWIDDQGSAHYTDGLQAVPERYRATAVPLGYKDAPPSPPRPGFGAPAVLAGTASIPYTPGKAIVVDVRLNGRIPARLILDTGADRTLISPRSLMAAGAELKRAIGRGEMRGVTGREQVLFVVLESLEIEGARVNRLPVVAYEMDGRDLDGLLGRDFLDRFNVTIDASRGVVTLAPK